MWRFSPVRSLLLTPLAVVALACAGADENPRQDHSSNADAAVNTPAGIAQPSNSPSPIAASAPPSVQATTTPRPSVAPAASRTDGTVAPENAGATEPVTVKANPDPLEGSALLRDVRLGVHPEEGGWERIVFEFAGDLPPGMIAYVPGVVGCGSGAPVPVRGAAVLAVRFSRTAAHSQAGVPTMARSVLQGAGETILEARQTCDFEGEVAWAVGVSGRKRFKVTLLANPRRVVVDIKN